VDGQLPEHHHDRTSTAELEEAVSGTHDVHGAGEVEHNPEGEQTGREEATTGAAANVAHGEDTDHGHHAETGTGHVHTSPPSMMWPLYVLALLSLVGGAVLGPTGIFERFLSASVAPMELGGLREGPELLSPIAGYVISSIVAIAGLALAYWLYAQHMQTGELAPEAQKQRNPLYGFLAEKWEFDTVYNWLFIQEGGIFATRFLWKGIDQDVIDGFVNGVAGLVGRLSAIGRRAQTGYVRNYALVMLVGMVVLVVGLLAKLVLGT
jgi:NADH-quinone oxidoreductase subunit L